MAAGATKSEPRVMRKESIRELLKKAVDENAQEGNEEKKVNKSSKARRQTLEKIKSGEALLKDQDENIDANTYEPEEKNVKRRKDKSRKGAMEGVENPTYENDEKELETPVAKPRKPRKEMLEATSDDRPMTIDELATSPVKEKKKRKKRPPSPAPPEEVPSQEDTKKESKKKNKEKKSEEKNKKKKQTADEKTPEVEVAHPSDAHSEVEGKKSPKKKKKAEEKPPEEEVTQQQQSEAEVISPKKKNKKIKISENAGAEQAAEVSGQGGQAGSELQEPAPTEPVKDDGRILGVTVHRTDKLRSDLAISHPLVKVSLVDAETGAYVKKQTVERPVTSFFESSKRQVENVMPIMTQPYDYRAKRSIIPDWNEMVLFNENFNHFTGETPSTIVFFELLDFVSMNQASERYARAREDGGWYRIAWAFLKIRGANGVLNTEKRTRLQLYCCPSRFKPQEGCPDVYIWWKFYARETYPSTLYVTLKSVIPPESLQPAARSMIATQAELGSTTYKELRKSLRTQKDKALAKKASPALWGRLPGQKCKIPNSRSMTLPAGRMGCYVVKFSNDGRLLACGCHDRQEYTIMLYEIPSGKLKVMLTGHYGLIYELSWCNDDRFLVSASGDGTARVWESETFEDVTHKLLPHPAFVYTAQFHPREARIVATGCYDRMIRIWDISVPGQNGQLVQEIDYHQGHVNSLCFDQEGGRLYSADNAGALVVWLVHVTENPNKPPFLRDWSLYQEIRDEELKGTPISDIKVFYGDRRLLIQSRDNTIRLMDLRVFSIMQRYMGSLNFREHIHSAVTSCGSFVMAGSEDNVAYVWDTETGNQVAMYDELNYHNAVTDVDYHPHEHMAAFCSYGDNQPVLIYTFDPKAAKQILPESVATVKGKPPAKRLEDPLTASFFDEMKNLPSYDARYSKVMQKLGSVVTATSALRDSSPSRQQESWGTFSQSQIMTRGQAWQPTFSSVARMGQPTEQMFMNLDSSQGRAQFSFKSASDNERELPKCLVLYDYKAARSDELDLHAGDRVSILYKDNDNWWMGQVGSRQGYFPSNYVEEQRPEDDLEPLSSSEDEKTTKMKMTDILAITSGSSIRNSGLIGSGSMRKRSDSVGSNHSLRSAARQRRNSRQMESTS